MLYIERGLWERYLARVAMAVLPERFQKTEI